jgi:hypothetical protein
MKIPQSSGSISPVRQDKVAHAKATISAGGYDINNSAIWATVEKGVLKDIKRAQ